LIFTQKNKWGALIIKTKEGVMGKEEKHSKNG
jgi:ribosomal protein S8